MTTSEKQRKNSNKPVWIIPFVLIIILASSVGGYYVYSAYDENRDEQQRQVESSQQESIAQSVAQSIEQSELSAMREVVKRDVFYAGIYIDNISMEDKTYQGAQTELKKQDELWRQLYGVTLKLGDQTWPLTDEDASLTSDWQAILDNAWQIGRSSTKTSEADQIRDRYAVLETLKQKPQYLSISRTYDAAQVRARVISIADTLKIEPVGAKASAFDAATKKFTLSEQKPGRTVNGEACADEVLKLLAANRFGEIVSFTPETIKTGMNAATMQSKLGFVSQGITYASKVNPNRDNNILLICQKLNGMLLQPGETFSFNGYVGERTAAKGFKEAGGIKDGILIAELGGGICQPNTTLCHAVLKADLEIVERHPHSWPSDYVAIGLDATVTWKGADFKFKNNTDYPVALVASYKKPNIVVQVYGRMLETGVTIELESEHNGYIPESAPIETYNPALKAGERVEIRAPHTGQRATGFKVWKKNGVVIKREVAFTSYYRPIQGLYEFGPPAPTPAPTNPPIPTPVVTPTVAPSVTPVPG